MSKKPINDEIIEGLKSYLHEQGIEGYSLSSIEGHENDIHLQWRNGKISSSEYQNIYDKVLERFGIRLYLSTRYIYRENHDSRE